MSRKREPVAEIGADGYRIVRHTHDIDLARRLMAKAMAADDGCPAWDDWPTRKQHTCTEECVEFALKYWAPRLDKPRQIYVRIQYALPNTSAEAEGWPFAYHESLPGRGAFPAVVFR